MSTKYSSDPSPGQDDRRDRSAEIEHLSRKEYKMDPVSTGTVHNEGPHRIRIHNNVYKLPYSFLSFTWPGRQEGETCRNCTFIP